MVESKSRILTMAHLPPELEHVWLQHLRDFDVALSMITSKWQSGCAKQARTIAEMKRKLDEIKPNLPIMQIYDRDTKGSA